MSEQIDRHWHWEFCAYDGEPTSEVVKWGVRVIVIGYMCEADARIAAADIVTRQQYQLTQVWECISCGYKQQYAEVIREMAENMKG